MTEAVVRRHSALAAMKFLPGNVLRLRMLGPLSRAVLGGFAADAVAQYGSQAQAFVLDYRCAILAVTQCELSTLCVGIGDNSPLRAPGAFVCRPADAELFRLHAQHMARAGFLRRTFLNADDAHVWAVRQIEWRRLNG